MTPTDVASFSGTSPTELYHNSIRDGFHSNVRTVGTFPRFYERTAGQGSVRQPSSGRCRCHTLSYSDKIVFYRRAASQMLRRLVSAADVSCSYCSVGYWPAAAGIQVFMSFVFQNYRWCSTPKHQGITVTRVIAHALNSYCQHSQLLPALSA